MSETEAKGAEVIEALKAKMTDEQRKRLDEALAANTGKPPHVHMDKDGNVFVGEEADNIVDLKTAKTEKKSATEVKRVRQLEERIRRTMNQHKASREQAIQIIMREDYERLPVDKKVARLEAMLANFMRQVGTDMTALMSNQQDIGFAYDINYRATEKLMLKLGITDEQFKAVMDEAKAEAEAEAKASAEKALRGQQEQIRKQKEAREKVFMDKELEGANKPGEEPKGAEIPKDATVFGE